MNKKNFCIVLLGLLFGGQILAMQEDGSDDDSEYGASNSFQEQDYTPLSTMKKRPLRGSAGSAKRQRRSLPQGVVINCMYLDCDNSFNVTDSRGFDCFKIHVCSKAHMPDDYKNALSMVKKVVEGEKNKTFFAECLKDGCTQIFYDDRESSLASTLVQHWHTQAHDPNLYNKMKEFFYTRIESLGARIPDLPRHSIKCMYPGCSKIIGGNKVKGLITNLRKHMNGDFHNKDSYGHYYRYFSDNARKTSEWHLACPIPGCRKGEVSGPEWEIFRRLLCHVYSRKHDFKRFDLVDTYVRKTLPELFPHTRRKVYLDKGVNQIVDEYISLYPDQGEYQVSVIEN